MTLVSPRIYEASQIDRRLYAALHANARQYGALHSNPLVYLAGQVDPRKYTATEVWTPAAFTIASVIMLYTFYEWGDHIHFTVNIANAGGEGETSFMWELLDSEDNILDSGNENTGIIKWKSTKGTGIVTDDYTYPTGNTMIRVRARLTAEDDWTYSSEALWIFSITPPQNPIPRDPPPPPG